MTATTVPIQDQAFAIVKSGTQHGVPIPILVGVYGAETNFGRGIDTSSANAQGPFQFIPSTASSYNYPLTNTPSTPQFYAQADAAGRLLSDLHKQYGSWDAALQHYSGGAYGLAHVQSLAGQTPGDLSGALKKSGKGIGAGTGAGAGSFLPGPLAGVPLPGIANPLSGVDAIGNFFTILTDPHTWLRVLEVLGAAALILFGVVELAGAGDQVSPIHQVRSRA